MCGSQSSKRMLIPLLSQQRRLHQQLPRLHLRRLKQQSVQVVLIQLLLLPHQHFLLCLQCRLRPHQRRLHRLHRLLPQRSVQVQWSVLCHLPHRKLRSRKLLPESLPCGLMVIQQRLLQNLPHSVHHQRCLR
jgi:hypothetical protein